MPNRRLGVADRAFDVGDYGAVGAGSPTDDTGAIQAAIDACEAVGGGEVYFPSGDYYLSSGLTVSLPGVRLNGAGTTSEFAGASAVRMLTDQPIVCLTIAPSGHAFGGPSIERIAFHDTGGQALGAIKIDGMHNTEFRSVGAYNFTVGYGVMLTGSPQSTTIWHPRIRGCLYGVRGSGIVYPVTMIGGILQGTGVAAGGTGWEIPQGGTSAVYNTSIQDYATGVHIFGGSQYNRIAARLEQTGVNNQLGTAIKVEDAVQTVIAGASIHAFNVGIEVGAAAVDTKIGLNAHRFNTTYRTVDAAATGTVEVATNAI